VNLTLLLKMQKIDGATLTVVVVPPVIPPLLGGAAVGFGGFNFGAERKRRRDEVVAGVLALLEVQEFMRRR
jgi:hypothetical protein